MTRSLVLVALVVLLGAKREPSLLLLAVADRERHDDLGVLRYRKWRLALQALPGRR